MIGWGGATGKRFFVLLFLSLQKVKKRDHVRGTREIQNFNSACVV